MIYHWRPSHKYHSKLLYWYRYVQEKTEFQVQLINRINFNTEETPVSRVSSEVDVYQASVDTLFDLR
jgi:hypothetical protein